MRMEPSTTQETSAGGVLFRRRAGQSEVCLVLRDRHQRHAWCLPKGHLEPGEDAPTAARREVQEETGWTGDIVEPLGTISYQFIRPGTPQPVSKTVSFFLMRALPSVRGRPDPVEVAEARWVTIEDAMELAAYDNERDILQRAQRALRTRAP